jgi:DnaJ domain
MAKLIAVPTRVLRLPLSQPQRRILGYSQICRFYFTNGDVIKRNDPYALLGLSWGDGATTSEIKAAYKKQAALLHPDVAAARNVKPEVAREKFQQLQQAYEAILALRKHGDGEDSHDAEQWRFRMWRKGDLIAMDRTDVAGVKRQRPQPSASLVEGRQSLHGAVLGHPDGRRGAARQRGEHLTSGSGQVSPAPTFSSVGRGLNKWVTRKEFVPWNGGRETSRKAPRENEAHRNPLTQRGPQDQTGTT